MSFQWPHLLFGLGLIPVLLGLYVYAQRCRRTYALRFTNLALLSHVIGRGPGLRRHIPPLLYLLGLAALLVSIARPQATIAVPREQTTVMIVMDTSGSMAADDIQPNRMVAAKQAAEAFVESLPAKTQVGLVSFSSNATLEVAPTDDHEAVRDAIAALEPEGGTATGDGLKLAVEALVRQNDDQGAGKAPGIVVLLSDGTPTQGEEPEVAVQHAASQQVKVYTIGIGARDATPLIDGRIPVQLDETTLKMIARDTGGAYYYAAAINELDQIYSNLSSTVNWVEERTEVTALVSAVGTIFLLAAGLLSLRWFQRLP